MKFFIPSPWYRFTACFLLAIGTVGGALPAQNNNMGIGTTSPNPNAILDITSNSKGLLIPRLTSQADVINLTSDAAGLLIYNNTQSLFNYFNGSSWEVLGFWAKNGSAIYNTLGNVGIGAATPLSKLVVAGGMSVGSTYSNAAAPTNGAIIEGNVGIGTSTPLSKLVVAGGMWVGPTPNIAAPPNGAIIEGSVGLGTTGLGNAKLKVVAPSGDFRGGDFQNSNTTGGATVFVNNLQGGNAVYIQQGIAAKPGGGPWSSTSDARLKTDVQAYRDGLAQVRAIRPVTYRYNELSGYSTEPTYVGIIAQEVQRIAPYMVLSNDEYLGVDANAFTYMLINAVQELDEQVQSQQQIIDAQQAKIAAIEKALAKAGISLD